MDSVPGNVDEAQVSDETGATPVDHAAICALVTALQHTRACRVSRRHICRVRRGVMDEVAYSVFEAVDDSAARDEPEVIAVDDGRRGDDAVPGGRRAIRVDAIEGIDPVLSGWPTTRSGCRSMARMPEREPSARRC